MFPKIAIIYLSYGSHEFLELFLESLKSITYPKDRLQILIIDNPHPQKGWIEKEVKEKFLPLSGKELPDIIYLKQEKNIGFAGGNNVGFKWAFDNDCDYVFLHNPDACATPGSLETMIEVLEKDKNIALAQPLIKLHPENDLVNTTGNKYHYLGFGYCGDFRKKVKDINIKNIDEPGFVSGAALLGRVDFLKEHGGLDEDYFAYHEDLELSLRAKMLGYKIAVLPEAVFYHQYEFSRNKNKYYFMERNRWIVLLTYYKWPTLILLLPILLVSEIGLVFISLLGGWFVQKIKANIWFFNFKNLKLIRQKRKKIQKIRKISDKQLLGNAVAKIKFSDSEIDTPLLRYVANPISTLYWTIVKHIILW